MKITLNYSKVILAKYRRITIQIINTTNYYCIVYVHFLSFFTFFLGRFLDGRWIYILYIHRFMHVKYEKLVEIRNFGYPSGEHKMINVMHLDTEKGFEG